MSASNTSPSKMSPTKKKASLDCAHELLTSGKRNLLVTAVPAAVSDLAECCEIIGKTCGQTADECAEVYFYYGKALLELSRLENGVLGNALEGVDVEAEDKMDGNEQVEDPEKMSKDEKLEVEEKVADALEENFEQHDKVAKLHENVESEDSAMEESSQDEGEDGNKMETAETEEVGNLQLAWEMLELAKVVYTRMAASATGERKNELEAKLCDAYLCLGEVSIENENYVQAVADLTVCLEKRKTTLPSDSRSTAEAWYQLGLAQAHNAQWKEAEASLNHAIGVLESRITNMDKMEKSDNITKEVVDLKALVTEIKEKINDHKTMETDTVKIKDPAFAGSRSAEKKASTIGIKKAAAVGTA